MLIVIAYFLDLLFGDPKWLPHPVCLIGNIIKSLEIFLRKYVINEFLAGAYLWFIVVLLSYCVPTGIIVITALFWENIYIVLAVQIFFCYQILAARSLRDESMKVYYALIANDIDKARMYLSYIVGRDTEQLDEEAIIRATVETVAENATDGVVAPIMYMGIGGAPLGFAYKAINTMDSMIGYKNERYLYFGRWAAIADDVANFVPARWAAISMIIAALPLGLNVKNAWRIFKRDRYNHKSPNSAQTESVCAGALGVQLGGSSYYFGKLVEKPTIGDALRKIEAKDIVIANRLMYVSSFISLISIVIFFAVLVALLEIYF